MKRYKLDTFIVNGIFIVNCIVIVLNLRITIIFLKNFDF